MEIRPVWPSLQSTSSYKTDCFVLQLDNDTCLVNYTVEFDGDEYTLSGSMLNITSLPGTHNISVYSWLLDGHVMLSWSLMYSTILGWYLILVYTQSVAMIYPIREHLFLSRDQQ